MDLANCRNIIGKAGEGIFVTEAKLARTDCLPLQQNIFIVLLCQESTSPSQIAFVSLDYYEICLTKVGCPTYVSASRSSPTDCPGEN